jgi:hypothetical protein
MQRVSCEGAPRDLGLDQGRACRDAIRADARALGWEPPASWLAARCQEWRAAPGDAGSRARPELARDLARHFPHLDERVSGLAAGAGLPREALLVLLEEELADAPVLAAGVVREDGLARLELRLRTPLPPTGLVARIARPDGGYPFLALTRPGLVVALAGVNEHGLAGAIEGLDLPAPRGRGGDRCAASAALLLDQCRERLDSVEKALEWCERRPAGGGARLVFADAAGTAGALALDGDTRVRRESPTLAGEGEPGLRALLDPVARTLELRGAGAPAERIALAADGP